MLVSLWLVLLGLPVAVLEVAISPPMEVVSTPVEDAKDVPGSSEILEVDLLPVASDPLPVVESVVAAPVTIVVTVLTVVESVVAAPVTVVVTVLTVVESVVVELSDTNVVVALG